MKTSFVDFYTEHNVSPVSQDISDLRKHFQRRNVLLRSLGIPSALVRDTTILEFGPGSGHNATYVVNEIKGRKEMASNAKIGNVNKSVYYSFCERFSL